MPRDLERYKLFSRRALVLGGGQLALFSALAGRMYYLQVIESDQYAMLADENRISMRLLRPPRGRILDRFGIELASNRQNYRVVLIPEQTDGVADTLAALATVIPISDQDRSRVIEEARRSRSFVAISVADNLSWEEFARVNVHSPDLPGVQLDAGETRHYPYAETLAHVIGYVGAVEEKELTGEPLLELPGFRVGKNGIEKKLDKALRGRAGDSRVEVNAFGREIRELARNEGQPGDDAILSIDLDLQKYTINRLGEESAAAVVMDVFNGDLLAMASTPSFDPNPFNTGISKAYWDQLMSNERKPLHNKLLAGQYPPGSTFKMLVALAALENGVVSSGHKVFCGGHIELGDRRFHCWKKWGHGRLDMVEAIMHSCDIYFYDIAKRVGIDRIAEMAVRFGLGSDTGLGLVGEKPGLVPTKAWKQALHGSAWQVGETLIAGIGQGYLLTTPVQLAVMAARLANGGYAVKPRLVRGMIRDGQQQPLASDEAPAMGLNPAALRVVQQGMDRVVNDLKGTAYASRIADPAQAMAGKTGTVQVRRISQEERDTRLRKQEEKPWRERDHALFVAYAPVERPRYAAAVVVEHGGSGAKMAAPVARDLLLETQRLDLARRPALGTASVGATREPA